MITSTALNASLAKWEILPAEGERQYLDHRLGAFGGVDEQVGPAVFPEQLPTPTARHQHVTMEVHCDEGDEPATA
jgi:hypothetical protein